MPTTDPLRFADHTGRVALVTGAASGIGRAVVEALVAQGAVVEATDRDAAGLAALTDELASDRVHTSTLDVADRDAVQAVVEATAARHGRLDVLVCSAGVVFADDEARDVADRSEAARADWDRCMAVNLHGTVDACEAAVPHLRASDDGAIVTIGSISAHASRATSGPYPTSKAAALRYTKSLALRLAPQVRVNAVCPGAVWTDMQARIGAELRRRSGADAPDDEATSFFTRYESTTPLGRPQSPADVAKAVVFLASGDAFNITGQCLHVDGGAVIRD